MSNLRLRCCGLCLPPLALALVDGTLTLVGQSAAYWAGQYSDVNEMSPTFHHLLAVHPLAFAGGFALWAAAFVGLILLLPETLALLVAIAVTFGHTAGASTWLLWRFDYGYQAVNALMACSAAALAIGIRFGWQARPPAELRPVIASAAVRWTLCAALAAMAVWMFLWPRSA